MVSEVLNMQEDFPQWFLAVKKEASEIPQTKIMDMIQQKV